jgi:NADH dehydrogenase
VILVEGTDRVLPPYPRSSRTRRSGSSRASAVAVFTKRMVTGVDATGVWLGEERIAPAPSCGRQGWRRRRSAAAWACPSIVAGRVKVASDLTIPGHKEVFVVGDLALIEQDGRPVPGVAPAANQMGAHAALNVSARWRAAALRLPLRRQGLAGHHRPPGGPWPPSAASSSGAPRLAGLAGIHIFFLIGSAIASSSCSTGRSPTYLPAARAPPHGPPPPLRSAESEEARAEAITHSSH